MEKDSHQPESLATVTIKPDYAPSESFSSSEPPPAYHKPHSSAVQVAKIISFTVIAVTVILGCFMLASAYVSATASCRELEQEMELLAAASAADRFQPLQPEALAQDESQALAAAKQQQQQEELKEEKSKKALEEMVDNKIEENQKSDEDSSSSEEDDKIIHIKMPLELDFDDLANSVMDKNQKSKLNCIVERKRAEQVVDHQPKTIQLPFGLNLTTDPKFEHISGERMAILCESGHEVSNNENNNEKENEDNDDNEEETIMIQPIMIPIPHTNFQTHMPMQVQQMQQAPMVNRLPMPPQQQPIPQIQQIQAIHPMETMRPPMPVQNFPMEPPQQIPHFQQQSQQPQTPAFPPTQVLQHIAQQIIAQRLQMEAAAVARQQQQQQQQQEEESNENMQDDEQQDNSQQDGYAPIDYMVPHRMSIPEQILTQINRLPNKDVIVAFSSQQDDEDQSGQGQSIENQVVQQQRTSASEMNGRQGYARHIPMDLPMRIVPVEPQQQANQAGPNEEMRPHFVHPRSVRSVDNVLKPAKRVKRCSCDCAC
ncbi:uncharacterized protein [Onthophagus taurus]|uniref:uncharacterized protein isoform X1 n=1 Tax=Onthophagus taurus TaxID=166361 RepID=UPI0039BE6487